jgi:hypothetical protein
VISENYFILNLFFNILTFFQETRKKYETKQKKMEGRGKTDEKNE